MFMMPVSVIIPTYNEEKNIERCLIYLKNQSYPIDEIIVVDSYSEDKTVSIAEKYADRILMGKKNISYNRELGTLSARNNLILSTDGDTTLPGRWLEKAISTINRDTQITMVSGGFLPRNINKTTLINSVIRSVFNPLLFNCRGCCILFKKNNGLQYFSKNGYFPSRCEELILKENLGGIQVYDPFLFVWSNVNQSHEKMTNGVMSLIFNKMLHTNYKWKT